MARPRNQTGQSNASDVELSLRDHVRDFIADVAIAQAEGTNTVEASEEVIRHFQANGIGEAGYFWYQGVRVYAAGKKESSLAAERKTLEDLTFPGQPT